MEWTGIAIISGSVGGLIGLAIFRRIIPAAEPAADERSLASLEGEFREWRSAYLLLFVLLMVPFTFISWKLLIFVGSLMPVEAADADYVVVLPPVAWIFPAMFLAAPVPAEGMANLILATMLEERHADFARYLELKEGLSRSGELRLWVGCMCTVLPIWIWLNAHTYFYLTPDTIVMNRAFLDEQEHRAVRGSC